MPPVDGALRKRGSMGRGGLLVSSGLLLLQYLGTTPAVTDGLWSSQEGCESDLF